MTDDVFARRTRRLGDLRDLHRAILRAQRER